MDFELANETYQFTTFIANILRINAVMLHISVVVYSKIPEKLVSTNLTFKLQLEEDLLGGGLHPVALAQLVEVAKVLPVTRLATHKLLVYVHAVVSFELLVTTLADKHIATVLPNQALVKRWQRLKSLVTNITGVNHLSLLWFVLLCSTSS